MKRWIVNFWVEDYLTIPVDAQDKEAAIVLATAKLNNLLQPYGRHPTIYAGDAEEV